MNNRWILLGCIFSFSTTASAEPFDTAFVTQLSLQDYFLIFIGAIVILTLFVILLRAFSRHTPQKEHSRVVTAISSFLAIFYIGIGSLAVCIAGIAFLAAALHLALFNWMATLLIQYSGSLALGILGLAIIGVGLFLLGAYNLFLLQSTPFWKSLETPKARESFQKKRIMEDYWGPALILKVMEKDSDKPAVNARVIIKDKTGAKFFIRSTNTEGEVEFDSVQGHLSDFYAYVEGDENREKYRLVRRDQRE